jgi:hypothetical protein
MYLAAGLVIISAFFGGLLPARAQQASPIAVITWHASGSYIPASYIGKALPNGTSAVVASVTVFDGGKVADLSGDTIYWYLNDTLAGGGPGAKSFTLTPFAGGGGSATLKVEIPNYSGGLIIKTAPITLATPVVVVNTPYPAATFSANPLVVSADPYFFPVSSADQLSYTWSVNGQTVASAENPGVLKVSLGSGTVAGSNFDIALSVANSDNSTVATDEKTLTYQPLP